VSRSQSALIAQIRVVMQSLTVPAPHVLALIEDVEHLDVTQLQLPLVEFSPFATLSAPQAASHDNATEPRQRTSAPTVPFVPSPQRQEATSASNDSEDRPTPVFSLRLREGDHTSKAELGRSQSPLRNYSSTDANLETSRHRQGIAGVTDALVSEMQQTRPDFSSGETPQMPALSEQTSPQVSSDAISWVEFATEALNEIASTGTARGNSVPHPTTTLRVTSVPETQTVREANVETGSRSRVVDGEVPLSPFGQRDPRAEELTPSVISHTRVMSQSPPIARMGSVSIPADRDSDSPSSQLISHATSLGHSTLDAEEIAALVNDILVEQARRNGVDLS